MRAGHKTPICKVCKRKMIGSIPLHVEFTCFLCNNPNVKDNEDDHTDTNWSDKRDAT
jgi:hypothetical protein